MIPPRRSLPPLLLLAFLLAPGAAVAAPASQPASAAAPTSRPVAAGDAPGAVFLFLAPVPAEEGSADDLASVLTRVAGAVLADVELVRFKTAAEMPDVLPVLARYGDLERLDRVSLINIRNVTGFDGLIRFRYRYTAGGVELHARYFDFRNGEVFRRRHLLQRLDAHVFATIQDDLQSFATRIRRSYRVTLAVTSQPAGALVTVDGRALGTTPLTAELTAGTYTIRVAKEGFRPYTRRRRLSNGDTVVLDAALYNPLAARFLNAPPGVRVDSRQLNLGYRYAWLGLDRPHLEHLHLFTAEGLLRLGAFDVGLAFAATGAESVEQLDTFLGAGAGRRVHDHSLLSFHALVKYPLWEKYSFAALRICTGHGLTYVRTTTGGVARDAWSYSGDAYLEVASRLGRGGNFAFEVQLDLGATYAGRLPYAERTVSLFGEGPEVVRRRHLVGVLAGLGVRMVFYNDIF